MNAIIKPDRANQVSPHIAKRSQTMTVERLGPTKFRVTPIEPGKSVRIVEFFLHGRDGEGEANIDCYAEGTLVSCEANAYNGLCSHVVSAMEELLKQDGEPAMTTEAFVPELEPKRTPTPWRVGKLNGAMTTVLSDSTEGLSAIAGACEPEYYGGNMVAESVAPQNAEFIVKACNAYERLVTFAKEVRDQQDLEGDSNIASLLLIELGIE